MNSKTKTETPVTIPFPTAPVSNGEWVPDPPTKKQRVAEKLICEEVDHQAKRHDMSRREFMATASATMIAFSVLNRLNGLDAWGANAVLPVRPEHCEDLDAAKERLETKPYFIVDVQSHHLDLGEFDDSGLLFLRFCREPDSEFAADDVAVIGQSNFIKEMLVDSDTHVAVISGLPGGIPLGPEGMAATRDLANELAGSERCIAQAMIDPSPDPSFTLNPDTTLDTLEHQVKDLGARALKCYSYNGNWRLDDESIAYPMFEEAQRLGLGLINCHKGLPAIFAPGSEESVRVTDMPKAIRDWPELNFCAYHSGYYQAGNHPEGKDGITEFVEMAESLKRSERKRLYAEIGSTFALNILADGVDACGHGGPPPLGPINAAHYMGQLLKTMGPKNILWGTDSIWWGSPQWVIDAFKIMQIPDSLREEHGYPQLTKRAKRLIFGKNASRLYGIKRKVKKNLCSIPVESIPPARPVASAGNPGGDDVVLANVADLPEDFIPNFSPDDAILKAQEARGGAHASRSLKIYGPQTRREFLKTFGWSYG